MKYFILEYKTESDKYCAVCLKDNKYVKGTFYHNECGNWLCAEHGGKCHIKDCKIEDCLICYEANEINDVCDYCDKLTCSDHINYCDKCDLKVCKDCAWDYDYKRCKGCGVGYCEKHSGRLNSKGYCDKCN